MPFPKKPLVQRKCPYCGKIVQVKNRRLKGFKFCSNRCKNEVKSAAMKNRVKVKRIPVKCASEFCTKGKYLTLNKVQKQRKHFCSMACYRYFKSKQYKLDLEKLHEKKELTLKQRIWRL